MNCFSALNPVSIVTDIFWRIFMKLRTNCVPVGLLLFASFCFNTSTYRRSWCSSNTVLVFLRFLIGSSTVSWTTLKRFLLIFLRFYKEYFWKSKTSLMKATTTCFLISAYLFFSNSLFSGVMTCCRVEIYRCFEVNCCLHFQSIKTLFPKRRYTCAVIYNCVPNKTTFLAATSVKTPNTNIKLS